MKRSCSDQSSVDAHPPQRGSMVNPTVELFRCALVLVCTKVTGPAAELICILHRIREPHAHCRRRHPERCRGETLARVSLTRLPAPVALRRLKPRTGERLQCDTSAEPADEAGPKAVLGLIATSARDARGLVLRTVVATPAVPGKSDQLRAHAHQLQR